VTAPPAADPPTRPDSPDELDRLCQIGAREMCGEIIRPVHVHTIEVPEEYL